MEERVRQLAYHDELTKLPNRRLFVDRFRQVLNLHRHIGGHVALMFIDLDKFKALNDQYGHKAGDQLLIEVARRLRQVVRESDTVARFGGDEFVVLLQALDASRQVAQEQASAIAEKIRLAISTPYTLAGSDHESGASFPYALSASIGVHLFGDASVSVDELLDHADTAMYRAKKDGRGEVRFTEAGTA
jgi:diguanylate cyclase (GGDEF)-like protein